MNRREVIKSLGLLAGHTLLPSVLAGFLESCTSNSEKSSYQLTFFHADEYQWLIKAIDIIIPATATQSASEANCQELLDSLFSKCLTPEQQQLMKEGMQVLVADLKNAQDPVTTLTEIDHKAFLGHEKYAFFKTIKHYTLIAFFTSREGETKASNYLKVPGVYKGEITVTPTTKNMGNTFLHYYF